MGKKRRIIAKRKASEVRLITDYSQRPFFWLHKQLRQIGYEHSPHEEREKFWTTIPSGKHSNTDGIRFIDTYLEVLELQIGAQVSQHSVAYWLHVLRRIFPGAAGENGDPVTNGWVRSIFETSVQKFAKLSECGDVAGSRDIAIEEILSGLLLHPEFTREKQHLEDSDNQLVLTKFDVLELRQFYETQKLCYEVWKCFASRRALGKGAPLEVFKSQPFFHDARSDELDKLIMSYDSRQSYNQVTATATVYNSYKGQQLALPHYNLGQIKFDDKALFHEKLGVQLQEGFIPNFIWVPEDLGSFYKAHKDFAAPFAAKHGVSLSDVVCVFASLIVNVISRWRTFEEIIRYWKRAYDGPTTRHLIIEQISQYLPFVIKRCSLPVLATSVKINAVFEFLELNSANRSQIDIGLASPRAIFIPAIGDKYYIDYEPIISRLYYLFFGLKLDDQNFKGDALEELVRTNEPVLPHSEISGMDGTSKQVDASFAAGDTLIIVECRAVARSFGMERGDTTAIKFRSDVINRTLKDIDSKAKWLQAHPKGHKHDITRFRRIIPIGVTPFREFIPSLETHYWINETLPRVLTPTELENALTDGVFERSCENSFALGAASHD